MDYNNFIGTLAEFMNAVISEVKSAVSYTDTRIGTLTGFTTNNISQYNVWQTKNMLPATSSITFGTSVYSWNGYFNDVHASRVYISSLLSVSGAAYFQSASGSFTGSFTGFLSGQAQYISASRVTQSYKGYLPILSSSSITYTSVIPVQYFPWTAFELNDRSNVQFQGDIVEAYAYTIGDLVFCYCKASIGNWTLYSSVGYVNVVVDPALRPAHTRFYPGPQATNSSQAITPSGYIFSYKVSSLTDPSFTFSFSVCYTKNGSLATHKW